ncbi:MAG: hypothetical protein HC929_14615 [Leptolyngbyaceae cyanobacterium SM2_5_2]|nr:hypothetical protein [Leptolyngbyaceae cyanobacterium SM2_5_2]
MKSVRSQILCCSRCRYYTPEGRRGGQCGMLGVPVQGRWNSCSLSMPVFVTPLPEISPLEFLPQSIEIHLPEPVEIAATASAVSTPAANEPVQSGAPSSLAVA